MIRQGVMSGGGAAQNVIILQGSATDDTTLQCGNNGFTQDDFDRVSTVCIRRSAIRTVSVLAGSGGGSGGGGTVTKTTIEYLFSDKAQDISAASTDNKAGEFAPGQVISRIRNDGGNVYINFDLKGFKEKVKLSGEYNLLLWLLK